MAKLKRSLFIGLGGTGLKSILHTKKRFIDTYGEVPPMVGFLAFDTDDDGRNFKLKSHLGDKNINLDSSEFLYMRVQKPQDILREQPDLFNFIPESNRSLLVSLTKGAGQVRSNGRFATLYNYHSIENSLRTKLTSILNADTITNQKFQVNGDDVEINMMFSVAGGTGSGTFIDMAYIIKDVSRSISNTVGVSTFGFAILPDVFHTMMNGPAMANVLPNGFGALADLDYLMHQNFDKTPLEIKLSNKTIQITEPPFDTVFTINNQDKNANTYTKVDDLTELIGLAMFTGGSELSGGMASSYDNVRTVIAGGVMNLENKHSWACGLGLSELYFDGNRLGNIFARKAAVNIINRLNNVSADAANLDDLFISKVKIRENNGNQNNDLIDSLLAESPKIPYTFIADEKSVELEIQNYLRNIEDSAKAEIETNFETKQAEVAQVLKEFIIEKINQPSGSGSVGQFLDSLKLQVELFLAEMRTEKEEHETAKVSLKNQLQQNLAELKELSFIQRKLGSRLRDIKDDLVQSANNSARNIHEIFRRTYAVEFFVNLLEIIQKYKSKIEDIRFKLNKVLKESDGKAIDLQNQANDVPKKFVKELHRDFVNKILVADDDVNINDFIRYVKSKNGQGIFDFSEMSDSLIADMFWEFTKELPKALEYRNRKIDEILSEYDENELNEILQELIVKSNPLWSYNYKGRVISKEHHEAFIVGVPETSNSVLIKDNVFVNLLGNNQKAAFNSTNMNDRIVIYRMEAAAPIYAVSNMGLYEERSQKSNISHHVDQNWLIRMQKENFSIYPAKKEDHNLEYWVTGFIYGLLKYEDDVYKAYSEDLGDPLDGYWINLGQYRDDAFEEFKRLKLQTEFGDIIVQKVKDAGTQRNQELINDVVLNNNYDELYSHKNFENKDLKDSKLKNVADLYRKEIDFVKKVLAKD